MKAEDRLDDQEGHGCSVEADMAELEIDKEDVHDKKIEKECYEEKSFEVNVCLHQGSVLSPLLFAAVMDVVSSEARSGRPS